ncbi:MAG TPA: PilZ domain-containing protein [bacterium]|nr:PilZ domain-containing protein [bacterium]
MAKKNIEQDRRNYQRYDLSYDMYLEFYNKNIQPFTVKTINICERGAFIKLPFDIELFERFKGKLLINENDYAATILFEGIIIRKEIKMAFNMPDEYYAGIYFEHIDGDHLRRYREFLKIHDQGMFGKFLLKLIKLKNNIIDY